VAALVIARGPETDSPDRAREHIVGMFFVHLYVCTKLEANVLVIIQMFAGQEITWREGVRNSVCMRKCVQPENGVGDETNQNQARDPLKGKGVVSTTSAILHHPNVTFDVGNMFILGAEVETDR
jgi:hypothetical protein